ncbi:MAG: peptidase C39 family protein [Proteobacteria bacterium]|nr:peptidase C39 family protein [Pseudomonadota bacterium]NIS71817.1 peptidase C39 family protein [Pseudomonadota bacterium]
MRCAYGLPLILAFLFSCAAPPKVKPSQPLQIIENVPFHPQQRYQCGPASLAGVLNYWDVDISPEAIAGEIFSKSARGTLNADMMFFAERKNLKARHYRGNLEDVRMKIDSGYPLIVLVDDGFWIYQKNHFMVVVGYNADGVIANSRKTRLKYIPNKGFLRSWERTKFWTLLVTPK